ncbi:MAG: PqqD family protein [Armatimonadota bacterium]|nr:PqqD family protein [Armatimonadota bacterium]
MTGGPVTAPSSAPGDSGPRLAARFATEAARFAAEVVLFDPEDGRLVVLSGAAASVWTACDGRATDEVARAAGLGVGRVRRILRDLERAGAVAREGAGWRRRVCVEV